MSDGVFCLWIVIAVREVGPEEKGIPGVQSGCLAFTGHRQCAPKHRNMLEGIVSMCRGLFGRSGPQSEFVDLGGAGISLEEKYPRAKTACRGFNHSPAIRVLDSEIGIAAGRQHGIGEKSAERHLEAGSQIPDRPQAGHGTASLERLEKIGANTGSARHGLAIQLALFPDLQHVLSHSEAQFPARRAVRAAEGVSPLRADLADKRLGQ